MFKNIISEEMLELDTPDDSNCIVQTELTQDMQSTQITPKVS